MIVRSLVRQVCLRDVGGPLDGAARTASVVEVVVDDMGN
jgi:hypothetical protein